MIVVEHGEDMDDVAGGVSFRRMAVPPLLPCRSFDIVLATKYVETHHETHDTNSGRGRLYITEARTNALFHNDDQQHTDKLL